MKKINNPTLKDLFGFSNRGFFASLKGHEYEQNIYNPFTYLVLTSAMTLIVGIWNTNILIFSLSLSSFLIYNYTKTKKIIEQLDLSRTTVNRLREFEIIEILYTLKNGSPFDCSHFIIKDQFEGFADQEIVVLPQNKVSTASQQTFRKKAPLDGGMGQKNFGQLSLTITDPFKIFPFEIIYDLEHTVEVFPRIENIPRVQIPYDLYSVHFGEEDVPSRGDSVNFLGLRPYRHGDPIRRINWRQTEKHDKVIVNFFERNINKSINILFNIDQRIHSGIGRYSTQEYLKDYCLAVMAQNINNGNEMRLITNFKAYPIGQGQSFINQMELELVDLKLIIDTHVSDFVARVTQVGGQLKFGSSLIYLSPLINGAPFDKNIDDLIKLKQRGYDVSIAWVDAFPFLAKKIKFGSLQSIQHRKTIVSDTEKRAIQKLRAHSISFLPLIINEKDFSKEVKIAMETNWISS